MIRVVIHKSDVIFKLSRRRVQLLILIKNVYWERKADNFRDNRKEKQRYKTIFFTRNKKKCWLFFPMLFKLESMMFLLTITEKLQFENGLFSELFRINLSFNCYCIHWVAWLREERVKWKVTGTCTWSMILFTKGSPLNYMFQN